MNCLETRKYITDFLQGNLDEEQCESFLEHMDSCKECQEELRVTHMIYEGLQSLEGEIEELQIEKTYQNLMEEAHFFIFQNHFFRGLRIVVHSILFWAVFFSAWYSLYGCIG